MKQICSFSITCATDIDLSAPEFEEIKRTIIQNVKERIGDRNANQRLTYKINCTKVQGTVGQQARPTPLVFPAWANTNNDLTQLPTPTQTGMINNPNGCTIYVKVYGFTQGNLNEIDFFLDQNGSELVEIGRVQSNNNGSATPFTTPADYMAAQTQTSVIKKEIQLIEEQLERYQKIIDNNLVKLKSMPDETEFDEIKNTIRKTLDFATAQYNELEQQLNDKTERLSGLELEFLI